MYPVVAHGGWALLGLGLVLLLLGGSLAAFLFVPLNAFVAERELVRQRGVERAVVAGHVRRRGHTLVVAVGALVPQQLTTGNVEALCEALHLLGRGEHLLREERLQLLEHGLGGVAHRPASLGSRGLCPPVQHLKAHARAAVLSADDARVGDIDERLQLRGNERVRVGEAHRHVHDVAREGPVHWGHVDVPKEQVILDQVCADVRERVLRHLEPVTGKTRRGGLLDKSVGWSSRRFTALPLGLALRLFGCGRSPTEDGTRGPDDRLRQGLGRCCRLLNFLVRLVPDEREHRGVEFLARPWGRRRRRTLRAWHTVVFNLFLLRCLNWRGGLQGLGIRRRRVLNVFGLLSLLFARW
eukprot:PhM_4_TR14242/c2_g1_i3/m.63097